MCISVIYASHGLLKLIGFTSLEADVGVHVFPTLSTVPWSSGKAGPLGQQRRDRIFVSLLAVAVLSAVMLFV